MIAPYSDIKPNFKTVRNVNFPKINFLITASVNFGCAVMNFVKFSTTDAHG
jgi:hypothetical protein